MQCRRVTSASLIGIVTACLLSPVAKATEESEAQAYLEKATPQFLKTWSVAEYAKCVPAEDRKEVAIQKEVQFDFWHRTYGNFQHIKRCYRCPPPNFAIPRKMDFMMEIQFDKRFGVGHAVATKANGKWLVEDFELLEAAKD